MQLARLRAGEDMVWDPASAGASVQCLSQESHPVLTPLRLDKHLVGLLVLDYGNQPHDAASQRGQGTLAKGIADLATLVLQRDQLWREREEARANELTYQETARRLEEFLATASHDLRTPLTASVGFTDLAIRHFQQLANAVRETSPDLLARLGTIQSCLEEASQGGQRLGRLVNILFDASLLRTGKLTLHSAPFDLVRKVREEVDALRVSAPDRVIRLALPPVEQLTVIADVDRIGQVLTNYVANAIKYSSSSQPIDVQLTSTRGYARIAVVDLGPGLPASEHQRIWQPYYRVNGVTVQNGPNLGLGLGLHICKTIIERHGGRVGLESEVGQGSTFWFTLPLVAPTSETTAGKREPWRSPAQIAG